VAVANVVLDTNIVIDLLKKTPPVVEQFLRLVQANTGFLLSPIVVAEVYAGAYPREYKDIETFFAMCQIAPVDKATGHQAGLYANQYVKAFQGIAMEDFLLAATAKVHNCRLWTLNRKHFPMADVELLAFAD
jgi:predicted nucleic acid-binding protein